MFLQFTFRNTLFPPISKLPPPLFLVAGEFIPRPCNIRRCWFRVGMTYSENDASRPPSFVTALPYTLDCPFLLLQLCIQFREGELSCCIAICHSTKWILLYTEPKASNRNTQFPTRMRTGMCAPLAG